MNAPTTFIEMPEFGELQALLGTRFDELILAFGEPLSATKEIYQSRAFVALGYHTMPALYGKSDEVLYKIEYSDGRKVFILNGKFSDPDNPFEVAHAAGQGLDLRKTRTVVYLYDGQTIREILVSSGEYDASGKRSRKATPSDNVYTGENANPDFLLECILSTFAAKVEAVTV